MTTEKIEKANKLLNEARNGLFPLNLQLFADEEEDQSDNSEGGDGGSNSEGETEIPNLDELLKNREFQSQFDKRVTQAINTAKSKWKKELEEEQNEAEKLEKMSDAERERYQLNKDKAAFEKEKAEFAKEQLKNAVGKELMKRGFSAEFSEFLTGTDAATSNANINAFETAFNQAVEAKVTEKMRGDQTPPGEREHADSDAPPKDFHEYEKWRKQNQ